MEEEYSMEGWNKNQYYSHIAWLKLQTNCQYIYVAADILTLQQTDTTAEKSRQDCKRHNNTQRKGCKCNQFNNTWSKSSSWVRT